MKIGLLIIATNKYTQFLQPLISSADLFFLKDHEVTYFVFTNQDVNIETNRNVVRINVEHKEWPWMTLGRYKIFNDNSDKLSEMDYLFYSDVDMLFVDNIGDEIIEERVATQHPGYAGTRGTPDTNPNSLAYVGMNEDMEYFAGGFNGGSSKEYLKMSSKLSSNIEKDYQNGIIAVWHDESHMNRYFIDNKPTKILNPSYCCNEGWLDCPFGRRLIALDKNHKEIRLENGI
jgi:histo-blood group ABO system transferase